MAIASEPEARASKRDRRRAAPAAARQPFVREEIDQRADDQRGNDVSRARPGHERGDNRRRSGRIERDEAIAATSKRGRDGRAGVSRRRRRPPGASERAPAPSERRRARNARRDNRPPERAGNASARSAAEIGVASAGASSGGRSARHGEAADRRRDRGQRGDSGRASATAPASSRRIQGPRASSAGGSARFTPKARRANRRVSRSGGLAEQHARCSTWGLNAARRPEPGGDVPVGHAGLGRAPGRSRPTPEALRFQEAFPVADDDEKIARRIRSHGRREHRNRNRRGDVRMRLGVAYDDIRGHGMAERRDAAVAERPRRVDDAAQARHQDLRGALDALQVAGHRLSDCGHDQESRRWQRHSRCARR